MNSKVIVILASKDPEKTLTGMVYASNALKNKWLEDVRIIFFGPAERLLTHNKTISENAQELASINEIIACKYISDREKISEKISKLGIKIEYVGRIISNYIKEGYIPMIW